MKGRPVAPAGHHAQQRERRGSSLAHGVSVRFEASSRLVTKRSQASALRKGGLSLLTSAATIFWGESRTRDDDEGEGSENVTKSGFDCQKPFAILPDLFC